jgi:hypothetical protein
VCGPYGARQKGSPRSSKHRPGALPDADRGRTRLAGEPTHRHDETAPDARRDDEHRRPAARSCAIGHTPGAGGAGDGHPSDPPSAVAARGGGEVLHRPERARADLGAAARERDDSAAPDRRGPADDAKRRATAASAASLRGRQEEQAGADPERGKAQNEQPSPHRDRGGRDEHAPSEESRAPTARRPDAVGRHDALGGDGCSRLFLLERGHEWLAALHPSPVPRSAPSKTRDVSHRSGCPLACVPFVLPMNGTNERRPR